VIFGDGKTTRDFTYIDNVIRMNHLAVLTKNKLAAGQVFNTAAGKSADLNKVVELLKKFLSRYDPAIAKIKVKYEPERKGDIRNSLASIKKSKKILLYHPSHDLEKGLKEAVSWYWENLR
jgi:UDP-N-acetylglucosamine 4-epimerase